MKIILINGPPRSGKSTSAGFLYQGNPDRAIIGFSHHLKRMTHGVHFGLRGFRMDPDVFDGIKDDPQEMLGGQTWRQEYIAFSEGYVKPRYGKRFFGQQFMRAANDSCCGTIIVPDSGFQDEAEEVVDAVGADNVRHIKLHRDGCDFKNDSRGYIDLSHRGIVARSAYNHGDMAALRRVIMEASR